VKRELTRENSILNLSSSMSSWTPKTVGPSARQVPVWSKSFASAIRGSAESEHHHQLEHQSCNMTPQAVESERTRQSAEMRHYHHYHQLPTQTNQDELQAALRREEAKIIDIKDILEKLDSMLNTASNTDEIMTTRNALHEKLTERCAKRDILEKEFCRVQHLKELNEEINDDCDDIFNQIERERTKAFQEYEHQRREDIENSKRSPASSTASVEDSHPSNTTPEPSRTPTMFNVNASEFKPSGKTKTGDNGNYCLSAYKVDSSNQKVTYHQPGYVLYPVVSRPLSTVTNNLVVLPPPLYIPQ
jgi:hypothetical protein